MHSPGQRSERDVPATERAEGELRRTLQRRFRTRETEVMLGTRTVTLLHPANADDLISEEDFIRDERLPYWADIWPSSMILARWLVERAGDGRRLLELGCGVGLVATAASMAGFTVTATDYYPEALEFARVNAASNAGVRIATGLVDWRRLPADLGTFPAIVASDVLYEQSYAALIAGVLGEALAPAGVAYIADPGRAGAEAFVAECAGRGLSAAPGEPIAFHEGEIRQRIRIYEVRRRG